MAQASLPDFDKFDISAEPSSLAVEWRKWTGRFENLLEALEITDENRKRAVFLYYAGPDVHGIYDQLKPTEPEAYTSAKARLDSYFEPSVNHTFEVYNFRSLKQLEGETIDKYVVRLKEAAARCGFADRDLEIKHQIVYSCQSKKVRRKALQEDPTLGNLMKYARSLEKSSKQANIIENKDVEVNKVGRRPGKYSSRRQGEKTDKEGQMSSSTKTNRKCYFCGGEYPHPEGRKSCPTFGKVCNRCKGTNHFAKCCLKNRDVKNVNQEEGTSSDTTASSEEEYAFRVQDEAGITSHANIKVKVNNTDMKFQIDSGALVNIICEDVFQKMYPLPVLKLRAHLSNILKSIY